MNGILDQVAVIQKGDLSPIDLSPVASPTAVVHVKRLIKDTVINKFSTLLNYNRYSINTLNRLAYSLRSTSSPYSHQTALQLKCHSLP